MRGGRHRRVNDHRLPCMVEVPALTDGPSWVRLLWNGTLRWRRWPGLVNVVQAGTSCDMVRPEVLIGMMLLLLLLLLLRRSSPHGLLIGSHKVRASLVVKVGTMTRRNVRMERGLYPYMYSWRQSWHMRSWHMRSQYMWSLHEWNRTTRVNVVYLNTRKTMWVSEAALDAGLLLFLDGVRDFDSKVLFCETRIVRTGFG